jgi:hypothetical protein
MADPGPVAALSPSKCLKGTGIGRLVCREAIVVLLLWPVSALAGQSDDSEFKTTRFQGQTWVFSDSVRTTQKEFRGRQALHVNSPSSEVIRVAEADFRNGEIEVDLALPAIDIFDCC